MCIPSTTCQHTIYYFDNRKKDHRINGADIVRLFNVDGLCLPAHFEQYREHVRQLDNPTPEEHVQNNLRQQLVKQKSETRLQKQQELTTLFNRKAVLPSRQNSASNL
jgi:hypothetical protein